MQPISPTNYATCYAGYFLQDCAVINRHTVSFVLRSFEDTAKHDSLEEQLVRKKVVWQHLVDDDSPRAGCSVIRNSEELFTTLSNLNELEPVFVNGHGMVLVPTPDDLRTEARITESTGLAQEHFLALTAKTIHNHVYVCGHLGLVACRTAQDKWINLSLDPATFPGPPLTLVNMDGFAPNDLYAVAMEAGVFHFDGSSWRRVPFPSNILLESVCCGEDGVVYVSGQAGTLFAGRGSRWREVHAGSFTLPYTDMIWHDNALWCTSDYGVWTFADNRLERAPVPDEVYFCSGHLSARDGLLLLGGMNGAAIHDGSRWQVLYFQPEIFEGMES